MALARTFNKINGEEWGKIIARDFAQLISRDDNFRPHQTFLEAGHDITLSLSMVTAPGEPVQEVKAIYSGGQTLYREGPNGEVVKVVPPEMERERVILTTSRRHSGVSEPPDLLRKQAGLYIPTPQMDVTTGTIVDVPREEVVRQQMDNQTATADTRRQAVRERDEDVAIRGLHIPHYEAKPVEALSHDVVERPNVEVRFDINRADRIKTELPPEQVIVENE